MKSSHLREKSLDDLVELQKSLAHDIFQNRLKNFTNRLDDTSSIRKTRRDLARVITLLRERAIAANPVAPAVSDAPQKVASGGAKLKKKGAVRGPGRGEARASAARAKKNEAKP